MTDSPQHGVITSPCNRNCCLDEHDICLGCRRSLSEIMEWSNADTTRRTAILAAVSLRKKQHPAWRDE